MHSQNEIYGWLIGYQKNKKSHVLAIIECKRFEQQTLISAIPQTQEFQEISSIMPQGIGPIGIYHSHPFSSEIFHSHTDDTTLLSLSRQFPNCVSIVTNGEEVKYYQMSKSSKTTEIKVNFIEPEIPKFLLISLEENFRINVNVNKKANNVRIKILNEVRNYFERIWNDLEFFFKDSKISNNEKITPFLVDKLDSKPVNLKIRKRHKATNDNIIVIDDSDDSESFLKLNLTAKCLIYNVSESDTFQSLNQAIKTELLSNNIIQKVYHSIFDYDKQQIIVPEEWYLSFFGFYVKILCFNDRSLNTKKFSQNTLMFFSNTISLFRSLSNIKMSDKLRFLIELFLTDAIKISKNFIWNKEYSKYLKYFKKNIMIKN